MTNGGLLSLFHWTNLTQNDLRYPCCGPETWLYKDLRGFLDTCRVVDPDQRVDLNQRADPDRCDLASFLCNARDPPYTPKHLFPSLRPFSLVNSELARIGVTDGDP